MREQLINIIREAIGEGGKYGRFYATETIRALESAGFKIVGRKPTDEIINAMWGARGTEEAYQAAFDAAPVYGEQP